MKCPGCGAANLVHDTRDLPYTYKGETTILPHGPRQGRKERSGPARSIVCTVCATPDIR
jgi:YgiT-type zinc finger domain-containing protein